VPCAVGVGFLDWEVIKHMAGWQEVAGPVWQGSCETLRILCRTRPAFMQADRAEDKTRGFFGRASDETRRTADRAEDKTRGFFGRAADDTRRSADRAEDHARGSVLIIKPSCGACSPLIGDRT
jgi:hypothetical protein